jgi:hypothetical protein
MHTLSRLQHPLVGLILFFFAITSCTKPTQLPGTASLTVVNAVAGNTTLAITVDHLDTVDLSNQFQTLGYGNNLEFSSYTGEHVFHFYQYVVTANGLLSVNAAVVYPALSNVSLNLPVGSISSLFLAGTVNAPDTLFVKDALPVLNPADSSMGIRFVNLSPGSNPVLVDIQGSGAGNVVNSLPYKGVTPFGTYAANSAVSGLTFEFRDAESDSVLATYTISGINNPGTSTPNSWLNNNFTIVFAGLPGTNQSVPQTAFLVNNY